MFSRFRFNKVMMQKMCFIGEVFPIVVSGIWEEGMEEW